MHLHLLHFPQSMLMAATSMTPVAHFPAHLSRAADAKVVESCSVAGFRRCSETRNVTLRATMQQWKSAPTMNTMPVPVPKVIIDQDSDPEATIVKLTFGDRLGTLIDTINSLKSLGLSVVKANVYLDSSGKHDTFSITKANSGRKIEDPELLEAIRLTIINNLLHFHPESSTQLAMGHAFGAEPPKEQVDVDIVTRVKIVDDLPNRSLLYMEMADRPGLLLDIVRRVADINISIESGEFYTEGLLAKSKFHVSYKGEPLKRPLHQVLQNSLRYFLRRPATEESSF